MTIPCSKEADIATLKENARWQNKKLEEIKTNTDKLVTRMGQNDIRWAKLGAFAFIFGGIGSAFFQIGLMYAKSRGFL